MPLVVVCETIHGSLNIHFGLLVETNMCNKKGMYF